MSTTPPAIQDLARQLLATEAARPGSPNVDANQALRASEKLRAPLTKLAGALGFSSLLSRALALAKRQIPSLQPLHVEPDGSLTGFGELQRDSEAVEAARRAGEVLMAEFLGLLVSVVGHALTLSLVHEVWPEAIHQTKTSSNEDSP